MQRSDEAIVAEPARGEGRSLGGIITEISRIIKGELALALEKKVEEQQYGCYLRPQQRSLIDPNLCIVNATMECCNINLGAKKGDTNTTEYCNGCFNGNL